jgi:hypothetical protein
MYLTTTCAANLKAGTPASTDTINIWTAETVAPEFEHLQNCYIAAFVMILISIGSLTYVLFAVFIPRESAEASSLPQPSPVTPDPELDPHPEPIPRPCLMSNAATSSRRRAACTYFARRAARLGSAAITTAPRMLQSRNSLCISSLACVRWHCLPLGHRGLTERPARASS